MLSTCAANRAATNNVIDCVNIAERCGAGLQCFPPYKRFTTAEARLCETRTNEIGRHHSSRIAAASVQDR